MRNALSFPKVQRIQSREKAILGRVHHPAAVIVAIPTSMSCRDAMSSHRASKYALMSVVEPQNLSKLSCNLIAPTLQGIRFFVIGKI